MKSGHGSEVCSLRITPWKSQLLLLFLVLRSWSLKTWKVATILEQLHRKQAVGGRPLQYAPASCDLDLWPYDLESGVLVTTCDVGYLCANFGLPRPVCSRLRPDVRDRQTGRQTDRRQTEHTHFVLTAIFPGEPGLAGCPLIPLILLLHLFLTAHPFGTGINFSCHS